MPKCKVCNRRFSLTCPICSEKLSKVQKQLEGKSLKYYYPAHRHYSKLIYSPWVTVNCDLKLACDGKKDIASRASICWNSPYDHRIPPPHGKCEACISCIELYYKMTGNLNNCVERLDVYPVLNTPSVYGIINKGKLVTGLYRCTRCKATTNKPRYFINYQDSHMCLKCVNKMCKTVDPISYSNDAPEPI